MKQKDIASATRAQILTAASRVILEKGVSALTLEAVARQAGISKGGLLYHFPNKNSLIVGMVEQLIVEFDTEIARELQREQGNWLIAYIQASLPAMREKVQQALLRLARGEDKGTEREE